ncbi:YIP1 family protein [Mammaliicoccus lentus]|uniref:YIP1 family protein n=1 Tax=Mammaliicoccus lentus TaxID=42858 RepID=UPI0015F73797|nr:YIP1 family protein [Mammaliicoccus lentus]MCD2477693.1 YIP1 family protein [Mammaliicoccus lentus]MCD2521632.1 YIP1 family protein [Mammaliicoccus lentus]QMU10109.1 YIP1 family protein [Mammaliicoccus lentus]
MENSNANQTSAKTSDLPLLNHFSKLRENPKWIVKLIIFTILSFISLLLTNYITDNTEILKKAGLDSSQIEQQNEMDIGTLIGQTVGGVIFGLLIIFLIFLIVSKIMKSDARAIHIFSASISYLIITTAFSIIVYGIQALFGLTLPDTQIDSLNVFDKGNQYLSVFNLSSLLSAYLIFAVYYGTSKLSKKASIIWAIVALIVTIGLGLISASFINAIQGLV